MSEALPGALPKGQNNPQQCPYGLYAEQLSGTAFTLPRFKNQRSWLYRIHPSVQHSKMIPSEVSGLGRSKNESRTFVVEPNQLRWNPENVPSQAEIELNFVNGIHTTAMHGDPCGKEGLAIHTYRVNSSMEKRSMTNADGDLLIVPQQGILTIRTEFGIIKIEPNEICVIQRGMRFSVNVENETVNRGYILEIFSSHFVLPDLGPIGSNGLANAQDFQVPVAAYENKQEDWILYTKFGGDMFEMHQTFSPYNVVAYSGNYVPYKYDLRKFCCLNSVTYDHPDPSIYTVLTCPSHESGTAVADFVIFPPRWMAMEHSFRPPWFHRNTMTEYMGMIWGEYDAKKGGFVPGGASLHSCMAPHGPDATTFANASDPNIVDTQKPEFFDRGLAFMFETCYILKVNEKALKGDDIQHDYQDCWKSMPDTFDPENHDQEKFSKDNIMEWRNNNSKKRKL